MESGNQEGKYQEKKSEIIKDNKEITQLYEEQLGILPEGNKKEELQRETGRGAGTRNWKEN